MRVHPSALKHGINETDARAVASAPTVVYVLDENEPWRELRLGFDSTARLLEVVVLISAEDEEIVIHAMRMRRGFRQLLLGRARGSVD